MPERRRMAEFRERVFASYAEEREAQGDDWDPQEELFDPPEGVT